MLKGRQNYLCRQRMSEADGQESLSQEQIGSRARGSLEEQAAMVHEWAAHTRPTTEMTSCRDRLSVWRAVSVSSAECVGESRCAFGDECFSARARARAMGGRRRDESRPVAIDTIEGVPVLPDRSALVVDEAHGWSIGSPVPSPASCRYPRLSDWSAKPLG